MATQRSGAQAVERTVSRLNITWAHFNQLCADLVERAKISGAASATSIYGIPSGGIPVAIRVGTILNLPLAASPTTGCLVVDDLIDSGATLAPYIASGYACEALLKKPNSPDFGIKGLPVYDKWIVFPWEEARKESAPIDSALRLTQYFATFNQECAGQLKAAQDLLTFLHSHNQ